MSRLRQNLSDESEKVAAHALPASPRRTLIGSLLALTLVAGMVDAVSFLALGRVFTANMTGNVVFLAFATTGAPGLSVLRSISTLIAFLMGAFGGGKLATVMSGRARGSWTGTAFGLEAVLLLVSAGIAARYGIDIIASRFGVYAIIVLTGLAMGLRNATVRQLAVPDLTTTVLTLTLAGLAADTAIKGGQNLNLTRRLSSVTTMFLGALLGAWLLRYSVGLPLALGGVVAGVCAATLFGKM